MVRARQRSGFEISAVQWKRGGERQRRAQSPPFNSLMRKGYWILLVVCASQFGWTRRLALPRGGCGGSRPPTYYCPGSLDTSDTSMHSRVQETASASLTRALVVLHSSTRCWSLLCWPSPRDRLDEIRSCLRDVGIALHSHSICKRRDDFLSHVSRVQLTKLKWPVFTFGCVQILQSIHQHSIFEAKHLRMKLFDRANPAWTRRTLRWHTELSEILSWSQSLPAIHHRLVWHPHQSHEPCGVGCSRAVPRRPARDRDKPPLRQDDIVRDDSLVFIDESSSIQRLGAVLHVRRVCAQQRVGNLVCVAVPKMLGQRVQRIPIRYVLSHFTRRIK